MAATCYHGAPGDVSQVDARPSVQGLAGERVR
jgi:hypothetical protein